MAEITNVINYLKQNISNLQNLILNDKEFKTRLINSLAKLQGGTNDFSTISSDSDDTSDSTTDISDFAGEIIAALRAFSNFNGQREASSSTDIIPSQLFTRLTAYSQFHSYWNQSMKDAYYNFTSVLDKHNKLNIGYPNEVPGSYVILNDLLNANAGNTFIPNVAVTDTDWVKPNINMYHSKYGVIRNEGNSSGDAVLSVLTKLSNLNFTHTQEQPNEWGAQIRKNIRLIMPKNSRRVEIEDLNRNFWVITQCIAAISGFLFDDIKDSLLGELELLLDEMFQIWDNILWLWIVLFDEVSQENFVHVECVPLFKTGLRCRARKFDDFAISDNQIDNAIAALEEELENKYIDSNLVILPQVRQDNYMKNYYKTEYYPCLLVKGRSWNRWVKVNLSINLTKDGIIQKTNNDPDHTDLHISIDNFLGGNNINSSKKKDISEFIGQILDEGKTQKFSYPASVAPSSEGRWFSMLRTIPHITASLSSDGQKIIIKKVNFQIYDVASQGQTLKSGDTFKQSLYNFNFEGQKEITSSTTTATISLKGNLGTIPDLKTYYSEIDYYKINDKSYYLGELASNYKPMKATNDLPFGEWYCLRPYQDGDFNSSLELTGENLNKIVDIKNNIRSLIITEQANNPIYSLSDIGARYAGEKCRNEDNQLDLVVLSRGYQDTSRINGEITTYDKYDDETKTFEPIDDANLLTCGNQLIGIYTNVNHVGSTSRFNSSGASIFRDADHIRGNIGALVHYMDLPRNSLGKINFSFPRRIEYFSNETRPTDRSGSDNWFVKVTALAVQIVDTNQAPSAATTKIYSYEEQRKKSDGSIEKIYHNKKFSTSEYVKDYLGGKAILTSRITIYAVPYIEQNKTTVSSMKYYLIQNGHVLEYDSTKKISSINIPGDIITAIGGYDSGGSTDFEEKTFRYYPAETKSYKFYQYSDYGSTKLLNLFRETDNFIPDLNTLKSI